ncbi:MAG: isoaspartyl peptidase/L-asparaginase [Micromonosporaceae bacterium]|nr:isoaspartyl peptidase/L-asparaginase [Micromonosporaceae bacterium]
MSTRLVELAPAGPVALALHGGAGGRVPEQPEQQEAFQAGLARAHAAGWRVLAGGGAAVDAVCAAVVELEDEPLFNAGRGAALTADGSVELDAAVMDGTGRAGAVAGCRYAKNPVLLARRILERSPHVLMVCPPQSLVAEWGCEVAGQEYFVTGARRRQLDRLLRAGQPGPRTGTVGAVARDRLGRLAAATSTGGMAGQDPGRVGDSPIIGAGTYARGGVVAISCSGEGEAFIRGVVAHEVDARMRHLGLGLAAAVRSTIEEELTARGATGGMVCVDAEGRVVVGYNSAAMFAAYQGADGIVTLA